MNEADSPPPAFFRLAYIASGVDRGILSKSNIIPIGYSDLEAKFRANRGASGGNEFQNGHIFRHALVDIRAYTFYTFRQ